MMKKILIISILSFTSFAHIKGQVVSDYLFSKMDATPQYLLADGNLTMLMGFTKQLGGNIGLPSPTLIYNEGDSVTLSMTNFSQAAPHTIHLHGLDVNQENDGVPSLSFQIPHDSTGDYVFIAPHAGTYLYHCHVLSTVHVQAGMYGLIIIRPPDGSNTTWDGGYSFTKEYPWLMSEIDTAWHNVGVILDPFDTSATTHQIPEFNPEYFLINGKSDQQLLNPETSIVGGVGDTIYMRLANIGFYGNRVIFPSTLNARIIASDGRPLPTEITSDTVDVMPGERYGVLLVPSMAYTGNVDIEYFNLNTGLVENTQTPSVNISGLGVEQEFNSSSYFSLYPNPAGDQVFIHFSNLNHELGYLTVYDLSGKVFFTENLNSSNSSKILNTSQWSDGLYFVSYTSNGIIETEKLIIKH